MIKQCLNGKWQGCGISPDKEKREFTGTVPGCVHTDLLNEKLAADIFWRFNGEDVQWIEKYVWRYEKKFTCDSFTDKTYIEFEGLDVYCDIFLNGIRLGSANDMFIPHRFNVKKAIRKGDNYLCVVFYPPVMLTAHVPQRSGAFTTERLYTRRMQCTYYWDWANRYVTCGIYKDVYLCTPECADVDNVYVYTRGIDSFSAQLKYEVDVSCDDFCDVTCELYTPDGKLIYKKSESVTVGYCEGYIDVVSPELWYPSGYGNQPLYRFKAYASKDGNVISEKSALVGIRTVKILQAADIEGSEYYNKCLELKKAKHVSGDNAFWDRNEDFSGFIVIVNGTPIMCKGANWVPSEPFPSAERDEKILEILTLAKEAYVNMIRVWGGGIFERDYFYETCDKLGIMITQDFLMACGDYPEEDEDFIELLKKEAKHAALRLRNHPSLVWWTGDNENAMEADETMVDYKGKKAYQKAIRPILRQLDPGRISLPSSPCGGFPSGSVTKGSSHNTAYVGQMFKYIRSEDFSDYTEFFEESLTRFCAEHATMGVPMTASLKKFMNDDDIFNHNEDVWRYHTKNNPAEAFRKFELFDYLKTIAEKIFGEYKDGKDRLFKMQYVQYEWIRINTALFRRNKWFSAGILYWMLNDNWPASGWSIIDYYALPKAAYYGFKKTAKPVIASISSENGKYKVYVCNDSLSAVTGTGKLWLQSLNGGKDESVYEFKIDCPQNSSVCVFEVGADKFNVTDDNILMCDIQTDAGDDRTFRFNARPQDKHFPETSVAIVERLENEITVKASGYTHAVMIEGEYIFSYNCFTMLPGETKTVSYRKAFEQVSDELTVTWLGK